MYVFFIFFSQRVFYNTRAPDSKCSWWAGLSRGFIRFSGLVFPVLSFFNTAVCFHY